jgi:Protein of unknown function DUF262
MARIDQKLPPEELEPEFEGDALEVEQTEGDEHAPDTGPRLKIPPSRRKLVTQRYDRAVSELVAQIASGDLILNPVYQRRYVWDDIKASKLIESLIINVPIPIIYLAEEADGTRSTIDGQQRLRSIYRYLNSEFRLTGLEVLPELNEKRYGELAQREQQIIEKRVIRGIVIGEGSHPDIRFDVFERLNSGSVALTPQEIRNSAFRGPFNDLLHELADSEALRQCFPNRANTRMTTEELVLRFFAFDERLLQYHPKLKRFLTDYMRDNRRLSAKAIALKRKSFLSTTAKVYSVFSGSAFRRTVVEDRKVRWIPQINSALYDVVMLNFARLDVDPEQLKASRARIRQGMERLATRNDEFADAISRSTSDRNRLHRRVALFGRMLEGLGLDSGLAEEIETHGDG